MNEPAGRSTSSPVCASATAYGKKSRPFSDLAGILRSTPSASATYAL